MDCFGYPWYVIFVHTKFPSRPRHVFLARIFSYACSIVYFTFRTIAILTALNYVARTLVMCFSLTHTHLTALFPGLPG